MINSGILKKRQPRVVINKVSHKGQTTGHLVFGTATQIYSSMNTAIYKQTDLACIHKTIPKEWYRAVC